MFGEGRRSNIRRPRHGQAEWFEFRTGPQDKNEEGERESSEEEGRQVDYASVGVVRKKKAIPC